MRLRVRGELWSALRYCGQDTLKDRRIFISCFISLGFWIWKSSECKYFCYGKNFQYMLSRFRWALYMYCNTFEIRIHLCLNRKYHNIYTNDYDKAAEPLGMVPNSLTQACTVRCCFFSLRFIFSKKKCNSRLWKNTFKQEKLTLQFYFIVSTNIF